MEKNSKTAVVATDDEPQLNYRGWKSMPFVIGEKKKNLKNEYQLFFFTNCLILNSDHTYFKTQEMKLLKSWGLLALPPTSWYIWQPYSTWKVSRQQLSLTSSMVPQILPPCSEHSCPILTLAGTRLWDSLLLPLFWYWLIALFLFPRMHL